MSQVRRLQGSRRGSRELALLAAAFVVLLALPALARADFGPAAFDGITVNQDGSAAMQAGGHPYALQTSILFNTVTDPQFGPEWPAEPTRDVVVDMPPGYVGSPAGVGECKPSDLAPNLVEFPGPLCPPSSQVGVATIHVAGGFTIPFFAGTPGVAVYNLVPPPGVPAEFGLNVFGAVITLQAAVRSGGASARDRDDGLTIVGAKITQALAVTGIDVSFWGAPADPSHTPERDCPGQAQLALGGTATCESQAPLKWFLRNPTSCTAPGAGLQADLYMDSWFHPGAVQPNGRPDLSDPRWKSASYITHDPPAFPNPPGPQDGPGGCDQVPFDPTQQFGPDTPARAGEPSGFAFDLNLPQSTDPNAIGEADLRKAVVTLPAGVRISPAAADGLSACSQTQIGIGSSSDPTCPDASKLGTVTITTPLLDQQLTGAMYLATPHDNPFGSLLAMYLVAKGPGVIIKLPGRIDADASSGQLTTTFDDNPQLPFSKLHLAFRAGSRAPLVTPDACGSYTTKAELTSWSGKTVEADSSFSVDQASDGSPCAPSGFAPTFVAGTLSPVAGHSSPLSVAVSRSDREQELRALTVSTPGGVLGDIASRVLCPDSAANAGACIDVSRIGSVTVGAGAGPSPFFITSGRVYITGPYKGAPFGLSIVVPAVAGPFDLGNVVVRAAIFIDRRTAALRVVSDPLPTILQGIPFDLRDVRVVIDRPGFITNPTSCAVKRIAGTITSVEGATAHAASRFQVGDCASLPLAPRIALTVGGRHHTRTGVTTPLTTTITQRPGESNLRSVSVTLPGTLNARLRVVNRACTLAQFEAGHCSRSARAGSAVAVTPLLRDPLRGSAYFVKNPARTLPDLMIGLRGQVSLDLTGKVSIPGGTRLSTRFDTIPDAPITKFVLRLVSGRNGPLGTVTNLCTAAAKRAPASIGVRGQNGLVIQAEQRLRIRGCPRRHG
jgi:hypothetical protein